MVTLETSLQDEDSGRLNILAELWGIDVNDRNSVGLPMVLEAMLNEDLLLEIVQTLPHPTLSALQSLLKRNNRVPYADFNREYGPFREMGPGRRDREKPWRSPISPLERLWYYGFITRVFLDSPQGLLEHIVVPDDLAIILPAAMADPLAPPGKPARAPVQVLAKQHPLQVDLTTLLAFLRTHPEVNVHDLPTQLSRHIFHPETLAFILTLLVELDVLDPASQRVDPERVRSILESTPATIQARLATTWRASKNWNDLAHVPSLDYPDKAWPNDPVLSRNEVLAFLNRIPLQEWWDLDSVVEAVRKQKPSFQRPGGDFNSWYVQDKDSGAFLRGYAHWGDVEGALIRFIATGPLVWLGLAESGSIDGNTNDPTSIRLLPTMSLLAGEQPETQTEDSAATAIIKSNGSILAPHGIQSHTRYQLARLAQWQTLDKRGFHYQLTPSSLGNAREQGLELRHILAILTQAGGETLPPTLSSAIKRLAAHGQEARLEQLVIVRVSKPELLDTLRAARSTARYIVERLSPTTAVIPESAQLAFIRAAAEQRILVEPLHPHENSAG